MQLTANQRRVLEALHQAAGPVSAYALLDRLREHGLTAPTQVYRALEKLIGRGLAHRLETLNAYVPCTKGCTPGHTAFAICDNCGHIDELVDQELNRDLACLAESRRFSLRTAVVEIHGICAACTGKAAAPPDQHQLDRITSQP